MLCLVGIICFVYPRWISYSCIQKTFSS